MKVLTILSLVLPFTLEIAEAQRSDLKPTLPILNRREPFKIATAKGSRYIDAQETSVDGKGADGRALFGSLLVLFDPDSKYYLWNLTTSTTPEDRIQFPKDYLYKDYLYFDGNHMVVFRASPTRGFDARQIADRANSLEEAEQQAINSANSQFPADLLGGWSRISLATLGSEFFQEKYSAALPLISRIVSVSKIDANWEIFIENRGKAKVILDKDFKLLSAVIVP